MGSAVLMCPPDHFGVGDVKNRFMERRAGTVDRARARAQWDALVDAFSGIGLEGRGYRAVPVDTGEFLKSGGSVSCLKSRLVRPGQSGIRSGRATAG